MSRKLRTLVIGGGGYIGSYVVPLLIASGREVSVLGLSKRPSYELPASVDYIQGDFSQVGLLCRLLDNHSEVIHLAYATVPNTSFDNPLDDLLQNLPPTVKLFSAAAERGVKILLVSSGGTVYGDAPNKAIDETHKTKPVSPYGVTKLTLENYAYLYAATHGLKYICVRPSNAYGIGQKPFIGQGFIATAIASALQLIPIKIFGDHGTIRDYIYITDLASGIVSALESGRLSETYNLGTGIGLSNFDIVELFKPIIEQMGGNIKIDNLPERTFDVKANILDSKKLQKDTQWQPSVEIDEGLHLTAQWLNTIDG